MDYEEVDKAALRNALLALRQCPICRETLIKTQGLDEVWSCLGRSYPTHDPKTWILEKE